MDTIRRATLQNGLQVLLRENHNAPVASFWIFYRVGSRNEAPGLTGISHWVEHMLFKGTERFPRGEFDRAISRAGGVFNGMTSQDWTTYYESLPADRIDLAIQAESDRMANCTFDPAETEAERGVIISEREGSENNPAYLLSEGVQAAAFLAHPYRHPIIGWKTDLESMTRDDLLLHYRTWYTPNNAVVVVVGDFESEQLLATIDGSFGHLPAGPARPPMRVREPQQEALRRVVLTGSDPTPYLMMAFRAPAADHPDFFPLMVMDAVLGGAKGLGVLSGGGNARSSRLYRALVESGLSVDASSSFRPSLDPELFTFFVTPAPESTLQQLEDAIWNQIRLIQEGGVTQAELAKAIKQTRAQFAYSNESVTMQAYWLGFAEVVTSLKWLDEWPQRLEAVTSEEVQRVAREWFAPHLQTVGWYLPDGDEGDEPEEDGESGFGTGVPSDAGEPSSSLAQRGQEAA
jgi:zinc protease